MLAVIFLEKVVHHPSINQDSKTNTAIMIVLDTTIFLMGLHKNAKDLNAFLNFDGPSNFPT